MTAPAAAECDLRRPGIAWSNDLSHVVVPQVIRRRARAVLRGLGIEVSHSTNPFLKLLTTFDINVVLDVGANVGQFALWTRRLGYNGRIVSFEPLAEPYAKLARAALRDPQWETHNVALGDSDGEAEINRSAASTLRSLAEQTDLTRRIFGEARVVSREKILIRRLDSLFDGICSSSDVVLLKIDTQGFEKRVLDGAAHCLSSIAGARLELSYDALYEGEEGFDGMLARLRTLGFHLVMLEPIGFDPQGPRVLQGDGTFFRMP